MAAGTSQSAIAAYESGRRTPTLPTLERIADALGAVVRIDLALDGPALDGPAAHETEERPPEDLTPDERRSLWLHRVIAARIQSDPERALARARANIDAARSAGPQRADPWEAAWEAVLDGPLDALLALLCSTSTYASQMRQTAPFAGILTPQERWEVYRSFARSPGAPRGA